MRSRLLRRIALGVLCAVTYSLRGRRIDPVARAVATSEPRPAPRGPRLACA